jgi:hypothetical protein
VRKSSVRNNREALRKGPSIFALSKIVPKHYPLEKTFPGESDP